jgi:Kef-type K+ transport system membrane component KefB
VVAPIIADLGARILLPVVVVEIFLGIAIGPNLLGWVRHDQVVDTFRDFGLAFLFFLAGWEIDFFRIRGRPVRLGILGWLLSIAIALAIATVLWASGLILTVPFVAVAISTTAIGAAMLSVLLFPLIGLMLRRGSTATAPAPLSAVPAGEGGTAP